ncbi:DNA-binding response regulator [Aquimarina sp. AD10]|uniref:response regulator n=1 Tax=Aquimarina sp. AD10 TaxID=1714849 RepID=UPI000E4A0C4A|nr:response regulator transcription factor [Aquimarina sp. AD10]AXT63245.1 DNA-binding response regulator [Aquimarina sp. AD10]RKN00742.1 response regulator [Aquimarina sp. AD10]
MIKVLIAEDHNSMIEGIQLFLEFEDDIKIVGFVNNGVELLSKIERITPDVVVVDIRMPIMGGFEATEILKRKYPKVKVIAFTTYDDQIALKKMLDAGASGYILKKTRLTVLREAIRNVANGETFIDPSVDNEKSTSSKLYGDKLTKRQKEILALIARNKTNEEIAEILFISKYTVGTHRKDMIRRLGLSGPTALQAYASENKFNFD